MPYPFYNNPVVNNRIFEIPKGPEEPVSIAILSDWASDTKESYLIAAQAGKNDYSIHLGDIYYVGNDKEITANLDPA